MLYLTVYFDPGFDVRAHQSTDPLAFVRDVPEGEILYRAVIDGTIIEDDRNA